MMQPGRETNYPSSSGSVAGNGAASTPVASIGALTITLGMLLVVLAVWFLYDQFGKKKGRR